MAPDPGTTIFLEVSIHRFGTGELAAEALTYFTDDVAASGQTDIEVPAVGDEARALHQRWIASVFAGDLPGGRSARRRAVNALHAATDVYTWKLLRRDLGLSRRETESTMADLVAGVLRGAS